MNKLLNEEVIEHEKEHCKREDGVRDEEKRGRDRKRERGVKEMQQLKIERTYPTMKMVFGELM